jgi:hypothetical protein
MVALADAVGTLVIIGTNTAIAAVTTRFFRLRLATRWGTLLYLVVLTPPVLLAVVLALSGALGLGGNLGSPTAVFAVTIGLPMALGAAIDVFWMPPPSAVDLPDASER